MNSLFENMPNPEDKVRSDKSPVMDVIDSGYRMLHVQSPLYDTFLESLAQCLREGFTRDYAAWFFDRLEYPRKPTNTDEEDWKSYRKSLGTIRRQFESFVDVAKLKELIAQGGYRIETEQA